MGHINLNNGFLLSTSTEICDEIALVFPKVIAENPIPLEKQGQDSAKIVDVERITPLMLCALAFAYPTVTTVISNRTSSESQGEVLGVYQSVCAAAMGLSPLFVGPAVGAHPGLIA